MSLELLKNNLDEITSWGHLEQSNLVPDIMGNRIFVSSSWRGRIWTWVYRVIDKILGDSFRQNNMKKVLKKTISLFENHLKTMKPFLEQYDEYLNKALQGKDAGKISHIRAEIRRWNITTLPFLKLLHDPQIKKIKDLFFSHLPECSDNLKNEALFNQQIFKSSLCAQNIMDLEAIIDDDVPFRAIANTFLSRKKGQEEDSKQLTEWVNKLNSSGEKIRINVIHDAFNALAEQILPEETLDIRAKKVSQFEFLLIGKGYSHLAKSDPETLQNRNKLKTGDSISFNGKILTLKEQCFTSNWHLNKTVIFHLENESQKVLVLGMNRAYLGIVREAIYNNEKYFTTLPLEIDYEQGLALKEWVYSPLKKIEWEIKKKSSEKTAGSKKENLERADLEKCAAIADFLSELVKKRESPIEFSLYDLMFNKNGQICFLNPILKEPLNFMKIEDFVYRVSGENFEIYQKIMELSKLSTHVIAIFFQKIVENALSNKPEEISKLIKHSGINDAAVMTHSEELHKGIIEYFNDIVKDIPKDNNLYNNTVKNVKKELIEAYKKSNSMGRIWSQIKEIANSQIELSKKQLNARGFWSKLFKPK